MYRGHIKKLGGHSIAMYLAGGYSGNFYKELLDKEGIDSHVIPIAQNTRENLIVVDESANLQYRFGMPGPEIQQSEWEACLQQMQEIDDVEYIVASGSLPAGVPIDIFAQLTEGAKKRNAKVILDTSGEPLKNAVDDGVFMIKPNLGELSLLYGVEELKQNEAVDAAKEIINKGGCEVMVISMGASGALLITKNEVIQSPSPTVKKRSTVGAGDSMVAGMVQALSKGLGWKEVLQYGIATGTATTMNPGTELCKLQDVERLFAFLQAEK